MKPYINFFTAEDEKVEGVIDFDDFIELIQNDEKKAEEFWREGIAPILSDALGYFHEDQERTSVVQNVVGRFDLNESKSSNGGEDGKEDLTQNPNRKGGEDGKEEEEEEDGRQCIEYESKCRGGSEDEEENEDEEEDDNTSLIADTEEEVDDLETELRIAHHAQLGTLGDNERADEVLQHGGASTSQYGSENEDGYSSSSGTTQSNQDESDGSAQEFALESTRASARATTQASTQVPAHGNNALEDDIDFSGGTDDTLTPTPAPTPAPAPAPAPASALAPAQDTDLLAQDSTLAGPAQGKTPTGYDDNATDLGVGNVDTTQDSESTHAVEFVNMPPTNDGVNKWHMFTDPVNPPMDAASLHLSEVDYNEQYKD